MAIFATHLCSLRIVYMKRITVKKEKNWCGSSVKTNIFCVNRKQFAYHLKSFSVPPVPDMKLQFFFFTKVLAINPLQIRSKI